VLSESGVLAYRSGVLGSESLVRHFPQRFQRFRFVQGFESLYIQCWTRSVGDVGLPLLVIHSFSFAQRGRGLRSGPKVYCRIISGSDRRLLHWHKAARLRFDGFFVQFFLSCISIGIGLYMRGLGACAAALLPLILLGAAGAVIVDILVGWPSAALLETYGVLMTTAAIIRCVYRENQSCELIRKNIHD